MSQLLLRDVLDEAIRCLAVSGAPLRERLRAAGSVLRRLSRADFVDREDFELFEQIGAALTTVGAAPGDDPLDGPAMETSDALLERVAGDVVDLRDTIMGRAISEASATTRHRTVQKR